jgi:group I intron endonuclease
MYICSMKRNISGIYIIKNNINNKVYIGSAVCCKQRFIGHKSDFKKKQHNDRFQNFVNKYGVNSLVFEILEIVSNKQKLIEREQYWIDFYKMERKTHTSFLRGWDVSDKR